MRLYRLSLFLGAASLISACAGASSATALPSATSISTPIGANPAVSFGSAMPFGAPTETAQPARTTYTVQRGDVIDMVQLSGRIVPIQQELAFTVDGIMNKIYVEPGNKVKQGDLLAELNTSDLTDQLKQLKVIYEQDRISLERAHQTAAIEVRRAQVDLDTARAQLDKLRAPPTADKVIKARAEVQKAESALETARNTQSAEKNQAQQDLYTAAKELQLAQERFSTARAKYQAHDSDANRDAYDQAREELATAENRLSKAQIMYDTARGNEISAVQGAEAALSEAQAEFDTLLRGPEQFEIDSAERAVTAASIALESAQQRAKPDPDLAKRIASDLLELEQVQKQIDARRLYAPFDGTIGVITARPGAAVNATNPIMTILDDAHREVMAVADSGRDSTRAHEALVVGQPAEVSLARFPGKTFPGVITRSSAASGSDEDSYSISYDVAGPVPELGDSATVTIQLGRADNVLWLPPDALQINGDRGVAALQTGDHEQMVEVQLGLKTSNRVEIRSGLKEGDIVYSIQDLTR
jgi:HlyD family secretion protein